MHDVTRIGQILSLFSQYWQKHPELRFFQVLNAIGLNTAVDHFFVEDDVILACLKGALHRDDE